MADNGSITLRGRVLDVTLREGTTTKGQPYRFHILSVLTGKSVSEVRWTEDSGILPREDEQIEAVVELDVFNNRLQINATSRVGGRVAAAAS